LGKAVRLKFAHIIPINHNCFTVQVQILTLGHGGERKQQSILWISPR